MKILSLFHINNYIMSGHTINRASWEIPNTQYSSLVLKKKIEIFEMKDHTMLT